MSEEKPRLSRREMREQGLLKVGREDEQVSRDDLLTRTSELQLRRPSRREMRLQREANEAKVAEQTAKLAPASAQTDEGSVGEEKVASTRSVHSFNFPALATSSQSESAKETPAPATAATPKEAETRVEETKPAPQEKPAVADSGRSSVFDRFHAKDKETLSFRDRLVARTREGQKEARETQPAAFDDAIQLPDEQLEEVPTQLVDTVLDEPVAPVVQAEASAVEDLLHVENKDDEVPLEVAPTPEELEESEEAVQSDPVVVEERPEPAPVDQSVDSDAQEDDDSSDTKDSDESEESASEDSSDSLTTPERDSDGDAQVVENGRYPTDVSMRLSGDDEEKTAGDRLVSLLIILVGALIGVILGVIAQTFIFGAEGIGTDSVDSVYACAQEYEIGI